MKNWVSKSKLWFNLKQWLKFIRDVDEDLPETKTEEEEILRTRMIYRSTSQNDVLF